ncbi:MAG: hypothetical protein GDA51_00265 [Ekhidna sp.]|nr:hypothetical protein [Ekhidna sp.]
MRKLFILLTFTACTSSQNEKLNEQSMEIHEEALQIGKQINKKMDQITMESEALSDLILQDSVESLKQDYKDWASSIVEVPNHEHDHHSHEGHNHHLNHSPSPDLTPEMVLKIQIELKRKAEKLNTRAEKLLEIIKSEKK